MLDRPPFASTSHAGLDLIRNQQNAIFVTKVTQGGEKIWGRNDVTAFTLDGLDEDASDIVGRSDTAKQFLFNIMHDRFAIAFTGYAFKQGSVWIREGGMHNPVHQGEEASFVIGFTGCEGDRADGTTMKST